VVNSGNANAFTGRTGLEAVKLTADIAARAAGCRASQVFVASTGVIGEPLDASKFEGVLQSCEKKAKPTAWLDAAKAIMTTDTFPKVATRTAMIGGVEVTINGMAKGAGMIAPDMATMLSFIFTDAPIAAPVLQTLLKKGADKSFNCVTVDSDTSTSDTLLFFATGAAAKRGAPAISLPSDRRLKEFRQALEGLLCDLAQQVARDGEGARKFVTVKVTGATGATSAKRIAMAIANSPLVKTAVAGEDANWGRVVMAVGKAGEPADRDRLAIFFGEHRVAHRGERDPSYSEQAVSAYMKNSELAIRVELGLGDGRATMWTCDLTAEYVAINADYRS
jgi:glutamate N-acetyltransferase/amino-acid N-acetyltransferase